MSAIMAHTIRALQEQGPLAMAGVSSSTIVCGARSVMYGVVTAYGLIHHVGLNSPPTLVSYSKTQQIQPSLLWLTWTQRGSLVMFHSLPWSRMRVITQVRRGVRIVSYLDNLTMTLRKKWRLCASVGATQMLQQ